MKHKMSIQKNTRNILVVLVFALFGLMAACTPSETDSGSMDSMEEMDHEDGGDHEHQDENNRIPNEGGATVKILSPEDGATFENGAEIMVEVEVENFTFGDEGNHWHAYVDGTSFGMVVGGDLDHILRGVEPGTHELAVYIANGMHEEYKEGDIITIIVNE